MSQWLKSTHSLLLGFFLATVLPAALLCPASASGSTSAEDEEEEPRSFNTVLDDLLDEFAYDLKTSQVNLPANVAVRKITLSEGIPLTYERYLETIMMERVRQFSTAKVVQCPTCRVKKSVVRNGRLTVVMPINNKRALDELAREYAIESWLDVGLIYQETSMILAFNLFDSKTKELLWSKVYNSESLYKKFPEGVPSPEKDRDEETAEEEPKKTTHYVFAVSLGWALVPNVNGSSNMLAVPLRFAEVFNKKKSEVGASVIPLIDTGSLIPSAAKNENVNLEESDKVTKVEQKDIVKSFEYGLGLFASYSHNFTTSEESLDTMRLGMQTGLGVFVASGYLSFTALLGPNLRMGHALFLEANLLYSTPTTISVSEGFTYTTQGGAGALATFGYLF